MKIELPTNRNFGFFFALVFAALSAHASFYGLGSIRTNSWLLASITVVLVAVFAPSLLLPFNKIWMKLGELMGRLVSPVVLGLIFFSLITPISLVTRLIGRDELRLKRHARKSYWIARIPPGPVDASFKNQF
jgi:hypothetical protein